MNRRKQRRKQRRKKKRKASSRALREENAKLQASHRKVWDQLIRLHNRVCHIEGFLVL